MTNSTGYENLKGAAFENLIINEIRKQNPYSHTLISHKFDLLCRNAINLNMFNMGTIKGRRIAVEILYCSKVVTPKIRAIQKQAKEFGADKLVIVISCDNKYQSNTLNDANTVFVYENNLMQNANYREFKNNFTQYLENSVDNNNNLSVENSDDFVLALGAGVSIPSNISNWNTLCAALGYELFYSNLESDLPKYTRNILAQEVSNFIFSEFDRDSALDTLVEFFLKETHDDELEYYNTLYEILYAEYDVNSDYKTQLMTAICSFINRHKVEKLVTYNFDSVLEQALANNYKSKEIEITSSMVKIENLEIYHVHGYIPYDYDGKTKISNLILTDTDFYNVAKKDGKSFTNIIQRDIFSTRNVFFIGCSFVDPNLKDVLKWRKRKNEFDNRLIALFKRPDFKLPNKTRKIAIGKYCALKENYFRQIGVEIKWFDNFNDLPQIINSI